MDIKQVELAIIELKHRRPFVPFFLEMSDGEVIEIKSPDIVLDETGMGYIDSQSGIVDVAFDRVQAIRLSSHPDTQVTESAKPDVQPYPSDAVYDPKDVRVIPTPTCFYGWLDLIREHPWLLHKHSLECLRSWILGYQSAKREAGAPSAADEKEFESFDYFVCQHYNRYDNVGWAAKIAYYHWDDVGAFNEFFKLLDEFRRSKRES
jgi:hypothetical protein